jgi:chromosome segregation ATPase
MLFLVTMRELNARFEGLRSAYRELQRACREQEATIHDLEGEVSRLRLEKARAYGLEGAAVWVQGDGACGAGGGI